MYKEDFEKFAESLDEVIGFIREKQPEGVSEENEVIEKELVVEEEPVKDYTNVDFEDI